MFNLKLGLLPLKVRPHLFKLLLQDSNLIFGITQLFVELSILLNQVLLLSQNTFNTFLVVPGLYLQLVVELRVPLIEVLLLSALS